MFIIIKFGVKIHENKAVERAAVEQLRLILGEPKVDSGRQKQ